MPERGGARLALAGADVLSARPLAGADGAEGAARVAATLRVSARQALALASLEAGAREVRLLARTRLRGASSAPPAPLDAP